MEFCQIQIHFLASKAGRNSKIIEEGVSNMLAQLTIEDGRQGDVLVYRAIMLHRYLGLELLYDSSMNGEHVVIHIHGSMEISLIVEMVDNAQFFPALTAALQ